jgi:UDP-N-acetylglucosamine pyrophosphorylase
MPDFLSIKKFKVFNTNNIWINLKALKSILATGNPFKEMDIICNGKVSEKCRDFPSSNILRSIEDNVSFNLKLLLEQPFHCLRMLCL